MSSDFALPQDWRWETIDTLKASGRSIVSGPFGSNIGKRFFVEEGIPVIRGNNLSVGMGRFNDGGFVFLTEEKAAEFKNCEAHPNDLLFTAAGTIGQVGIIPPRPRYSKYIISNKQLRARLDQARIQPLFAYYWLASPPMVAMIRNRNTGSTIPLINLSVLKSLPVPVPPLEVQGAIVRVLSALDDRITLLRETNVTLETIAQALFKSWFVDFDPVHAKQQGRAPEGIDEATAALFPDSFEESELGLVPRGWRIVSLGDISELQKGCSYKGNGLSEDEGAFMFNLGCFNQPRVFATEKIKRYVGEYRERHSVVAGDLIIANTDMTQDRAILGRPLIVPEGYLPGFISHHVFKVSPLGEYQSLIKTFLFYSFLQQSFRERAVGYATGTTVLALPKEALVIHRLIMPDQQSLSAFFGVVEAILLSVGKNLQQMQTLATLRDTLLPRLISGQLRLPEAEAVLDEALT